MPAKRPKNLLLDVGALTYGEAYANHHGTTLSQLVEDFLNSLPSFAEPTYQTKSAVVSDLYGSAVVSAKDAAQQRDFLERWRRRRGKA
jgi:hypothetical protein